MGNAIALIFVRDHVVKRFKILELYRREFSPLRVRFQAGAQFPFAAVPGGGNQPRLALLGFLAPFVFFHTSRNGRPAPETKDSLSSDAVVSWKVFVRC